MSWFGYKKSEVEDALRRSTRAVLIGGLFHPNDTEAFGLNEEASAWLYTEVQAHLIYCIAMVFNTKIYGKKSWATSEFMLECIKNEIMDYEKELGMSPGVIMHPIFKRFYEFEALTPDERVNLKHCSQSAELVSQKDNRANADLLTNLFASRSREFIGILAERF